MLLDGPTGVIDGAGAATVVTKPVNAHHRWDITRITVQLTGGIANLGGEVRVYIGQPDNGNLLDGSNTPWLDYFADNFEVRPPLYLTAVFTGCVSGSIATLLVSGMDHEE